jgi:hypothetical protein
MDAATEKIVYEESTRLLASQEGVLVGLRGRAGTLLAAASLVTAFLAPGALEVRDPQTNAMVRQFDTLAWIATGSFVAVVLAALIILLGYRWTFGHSARDLMDVLLDTQPPADEATVLRHLAYYNDVNHTQNQTKLGRLFVIFELGCLLLIIEIAVWLAALAT